MGNKTIQFDDLVASVDVEYSSIHVHSSLFCCTPTRRVEKVCSSTRLTLDPLYAQCHQLELVSLVPFFYVRGMHGILQF